MMTMVAMIEDDDDDVVYTAGGSVNMWCTGETAGASTEQVQRNDAH